MLTFVEVKIDIEQRKLNRKEQKKRKAIEWILAARVDRNKEGDIATKGTNTKQFH